MKVIFSRKGFDSSFGGGPSPLIGDRPRSLPIPAGKDPSKIRYCDMAEPYPSLVRDLYGSARNPIREDHYCHLDPDIDREALDRINGWRGAYGQSGGWATYLKNQAVGPGDLFLFFGLFRPAIKRDGRWHFYGDAHHRIFGWLQIAEVIECSLENRPCLADKKWLAQHPHVLDGNANPNLIFLAADHLDFRPGHVGWGVFPEGLRLSDQATPSFWKMPDWANPLKGGVGLSRHSLSRWQEGGLLRTVSPGQEFIADVESRDDAMVWLRRLFEDQSAMA